ncbi:transposase [uncultured Clostridium sp.]|uniref:transposase n=1 Tax=uncultured Clostridium sp. TaxID=59620 RepID=UPI0025DC2AAC|nr:transposase [uncultured Clostridium sp.]
MERQYKYSFEDKIKAAKDYISGTRSCRQIYLDLGIRYGNTRGDVVRNWSKLYQVFFILKIWFFP